MKPQPEQVPPTRPSDGWKVGLPTIDDRPPERLDPEHRAAVAVGRDQIRRGEMASAEEVEAAFRLFDP